MKSWTPVPSRFARFIADPELDLRRRLRFEERQAGADLARFLDEQSKAVAQLDRGDADFDPGGGVSIGQEPLDRSRLAPNLDPSAPNRSRSRAFQDSAALRGKVETGSRAEEARNRSDLNQVQRRRRRGFSQHQPIAPSHPGELQSAASDSEFQPLLVSTSNAWPEDGLRP